MALSRIALGRATPRFVLAGAAPRVAPRLVARRPMSGGSEMYDIAGKQVSTEQLVVGIMGFYTSLYFVSKLFKGKPKEAVPVGASRRARTPRSSRGSVCWGRVTASTGGDVRRVWRRCRARNGERRERPENAHKHTHTHT